MLTEESLGAGLRAKVDHTTGEHTAEVLSVKNIGPSKFNPEKNQAEFEFILGDGNKVRKWCNISFGKSAMTGYSTLAKLIEALTGIPCGDWRQSKLKPSDLIGRKMAVVTVLNDKGYPKIESFSPAADQPGFETEGDEIRF